MKCALSGCERRKFYGECGPIWTVVAALPKNRPVKFSGVDIHVWVATE